MHEDRIRNITGNIWAHFGSSYSGVFAPAIISTPNKGGVPFDTPYFFEGSMSFNASYVVPTGVDNAPSTFNVNYWRLINLQ